MNRILIRSLVLLTFASAQAGVHGADIEGGRAKTGTCAGCHGARGISAAVEYPNLAGQRAPYLVKAMRDYKRGARDNPVMQSMVSDLTNRDMEEIAVYYESLK